MTRALRLGAAALSSIVAAGVANNGWPASARSAYPSYPPYLSYLPPPSSFQQPQSPVFRASTDLVTVDALVTDSHGNVVTGLTAKDFQIVEKGRPQTITAFTYVSTPLIERKEFDPVPAAPVRDIVTNVVAPHSRAYAVVIDDLHLLEQHGERIRRVLTDLLGSIPTTDRVAVIFTGRSDLSVDLTDDRARQIEAVGRVREALGWAMDPSEVVCGAREAERKQQASGALDVLQNVSEVLAHTRADERTVVYLSEGFNFDFSAMPRPGAAIALANSTDRSCSAAGTAPVQVSNSGLPGNPQENPADAALVRQRLQEILGEASKADVRVYTIDPRGNMPPEQEYRGFAVISDAMRSKVTIENDFLRTVAAETGGLAAVQRSDMHGAVRELLADTSSYYLLGYTPTPNPRDGKYHDIDVKVLRPGLHVRARHGYTAADANAKAVTGVGALQAGLAGGDAGAGLALAGFVAPIRAEGKLTRTALTIEVTYPGSETTAAPIADDLQCEVIDGGIEGKGKVLATHAFHFAMSPTRSGDVTFLINTVVDIAPGVRNLRVGVMSKAKGIVGTVSLPSRIPNLADDKLQMPALVVAVDDRHEAAMPSDALAGLVAFEPTLSRTFSADETLHLLAPLTWGGKADTALVTITVAGAGIAPRIQTVSVTAAATADERWNGAADAHVDLAGLAPGDYTLTAAASVSGRDPAARTIGFHVR